MIHRETVPTHRAPGVEARLYSGSTGALRSTTQNHVPITLVDIALEPGARFEQTLPARYNGFIYAIEGEAAVGDETIVQGQVGWLDRVDGNGDTALRLVAGRSGARLVLYAGAPHGEALVQHGPFVAGSEREIGRMNAEFRGGRFTPMSTLRPRA